jgi:hypothetical protein
LKQQTKEDIKSFMILFTTPLLILIITYPTSVVAHETTHVIMYESEGIKVLEYHLFTPSAFKKGWHGYVTVAHESIHGDAYQENIAYAVEYITWLSLIIFFLFFTSIKEFLIKTIENIKPTTASPEITA